MEENEDEAEDNRATETVGVGFYDRTLIFSAISKEEQNCGELSSMSVRFLQTLSKKYLRCSARMMVVQLQKLLRMKLNIPAEKEVSVNHASLTLKLPFLFVRYNHSLCLLHVK